MSTIDTFTRLQLGTNAAQRVIALGVVVAVCYFAQPVVITFFCSMMLAFLLEPPVAWLMRLRLPRAVAALIVCLLGLAAFAFIVTVFYSRVSDFIDQLPRYESTIREAVDRVSQGVQRFESGVWRFMPQPRQQTSVPIPPPEPRRSRSKAAQQQTPPQPVVQEVRVSDDSNLITKYVVPQLKTVTEVMLFASFVPFLVYFMLSWKDHMRHGFVNLFRLENRQVVHNTMNGIGKMVRAFLVGNFLLAAMLAGVSGLVFWYLGIPFPLMMGTLSGLLSVIPYVGLPLAMIPPVFSALGAFHSFSSYLVIMLVVAMLHLFALNVLYPKLVGARVHLNPLAVTVSILLWTWMWGALGLILAIPITASLKAVFDNVPGLRSYGELLGD